MRILISTLNYTVCTFYQGIGVNSLVYDFYSATLAVNYLFILTIFTMKKQLKTVKTLSLEKRTVRKLSSSELRRVMGGKIAASHHGCDKDTIVPTSR